MLVKITLTRLSRVFFLFFLGNHLGKPAAEDGGSEQTESLKIHVCKKKKTILFRRLLQLSVAYNLVAEIHDKRLTDEIRTPGRSEKPHDDFELHVFMKQKAY